MPVPKHVLHRRADINKIKVGPLARPEVWLPVFAFKASKPLQEVCTAAPCPYAGMSQASDPPRAVGGMPYNLPLAMLQMDADPGSLTGFAKQPWSQGTNTDTKLPLAISSLQVQTICLGSFVSLGRKDGRPCGTSSPVLLCRCMNALRAASECLI